MISHLFKQTLIIVIVLILTYSIIKFILISNHKIFIENSVVKYPLTQTDKDYFKRYSIKGKLFDNHKIFYTKCKWSTKNNNYILFKDDYYIIEPGYYYYINENCKTFYNKNTPIYF